MLHRHIDGRRDLVALGIHQDLGNRFHSDGRSSDGGILNGDVYVDGTDACVILGAAVQQIQHFFQIFAPGDLVGQIHDAGFIDLCIYGELAAKLHIELVEGGLQPLCCQLGYRQFHIGSLQIDLQALCLQNSTHFGLKQHLLGFDGNICIGKVDGCLCIIAHSSGNHIHGDIQLGQCQIAGNIQRKVSRLTLYDGQCAAVQAIAHSNAVCAGKDHSVIIGTGSQADCAVDGDLIGVHKDILGNSLLGCGIHNRLAYAQHGLLRHCNFLNDLQRSTGVRLFRRYSQGRKCYYAQKYQANQ